MNYIFKKEDFEFKGVDIKKVEDSYNFLSQVEKRIGLKIPLCSDYCNYFDLDELHHYTELSLDNFVNLLVGNSIEAISNVIEIADGDGIVDGEGGFYLLEDNGYKDSLISYLIENKLGADNSKEKAHEVINNTWKRPVFGKEEGGYIILPQAIEFYNVELRNTPIDDYGPGYDCVIKRVSKGCGLSIEGLAYCIMDFDGGIREILETEYYQGVEDFDYRFVDNPDLKVDPEAETLLQKIDREIKQLEEDSIAIELLRNKRSNLIEENPLLA